MEWEYRGRPTLETCPKHSWVVKNGVTGQTIYPLVNVYITMEHHKFSWENSLQMAIFNIYVSLPEGISKKNCVRIQHLDIRQAIRFFQPQPRLRHACHFCNLLAQTVPESPKTKDGKKTPNWSNFGEHSAEFGHLVFEVNTLATVYDSIWLQRGQVGIIDNQTQA